MPLDSELLCVEGKLGGICRLSSSSLLFFFIEGLLGSYGMFGTIGPESCRFGAAKIGSSLRRRGASRSFPLLLFSSSPSANSLRAPDSSCLSFSSSKISSAPLFLDLLTGFFRGKMNWLSPARDFLTVSLVVRGLGMVGDLPKMGSLAVLFCAVHATCLEPPLVLLILPCPATPSTALPFSLLLFVVVCEFVAWGMALLFVSPLLLL